MGGKGSGPRKGVPRGVGGSRLPETGKSPLDWEFMLELRELGKTRVKLDDEEAVMDRIDRYFQLCAKHRATATITGIATALGCKTTDALYERTKGNLSHRATSLILQKAVLFVEEGYNQLVVKGNIGSMFLLKACFGYKEQQEITINNRSALTDGLTTSAELEAKYAELPPPEVDYEELPVETWKADRAEPAERVIRSRVDDIIQEAPKASRAKLTEEETK